MPLLMNLNIKCHFQKSSKYWTRVQLPITPKVFGMEICKRIYYIYSTYQFTNNAPLSSNSCASPGSTLSQLVPSNLSTFVLAPNPPITYSSPPRTPIAWPVLKTGEVERYLTYSNNIRKNIKGCNLNKWNIMQIADFNILYRYTFYIHVNKAKMILNYIPNQEPILGGRNTFLLSNLPKNALS